MRQRTAVRIENQTQEEVEKKNRTYATKNGSQNRKSNSRRRSRRKKRGYATKNGSQNEKLNSRRSRRKKREYATKSPKQER